MSKAILKRCAVLFTGLLLVLAMAVPVSAAQPPKVTFSEGAEQLFADTTQLTDALSGLLPGDTASSQVDLENTSGTAANLYFSASAEDDMLAQQIQLTVTYEHGGQSTQVYQGSLAEAALQSVHLCTMTGIDNGTLDWAIQIPDGLDNQYNMLDTSFEFQFSTVPIPVNDTPGTSSDVPKTGDEIPMLAVSAVAVAAAGLIVVAVIGYRRSKKEEDAK